MANICICEIRAQGAQSDVREIQRLLDIHTTIRDDQEITNFSEIVGKTLRRGYGFRAHPRDATDAILWTGELKWSPPDDFVETMSLRYPRVAFELKIQVKDGDERI
jgi:hypothetical protein